MGIEDRPIDSGSSEVVIPVNKDINIGGSAISVPPLQMELVDPVLNDYFGEVALGNIVGRTCVSKFGHAPDGIQVSETDIWDRANETPTQQVWLAPTAARIHTIASTSAEDDTGQDGVDTVIVSYLPDWDTAEAQETVVGDLNAGIAMINAAVIIHRMESVPQATTLAAGNVGTITATAAADGTITAVILPGNGQTEMAIYGVPSICTALIYAWGGQVDRAQGAVVSADFLLRVNPNPDVQTVAFIRKGDTAVQSTGTSSNQKQKRVPIPIPGPAIIKITATGSIADIDGEAEFDLVLVTN